MVPWDLIIYGIVTTILSIWYIKDLVDNANKGPLDEFKLIHVSFTGFCIIAIEMAFTIIWGCFYWL